MPHDQSIPGDFTDSARRLNTSRRERRSNRSSFARSAVATGGMRMGRMTIECYRRNQRSAWSRLRSLAWTRLDACPRRWTK